MSEISPCVCTEATRLERMEELLAAIYDGWVGTIDEPGLRTAVAQNKEQLDAMKEQTGKLTALMIGNGEAGIPEKVRVIEAAREKDDAAKKVASFRGWAIFMMMAGYAFKEIAGHFL